MRQVVVLLTVFGVAIACKSGEMAGPVEAVTVECPTSGERTCRGGEDCGPDLHCTADRCYANQAGCPCSNASEGSECGSAAHCNRGQCYANAAGSPCSNTSQCGPRAHCTVDTCYANRSGSPCSEAADCGPGSSCVSGNCN